MPPQTDGYPSDLTDEQWTILEPLIPRKQGRGRPLSLELLRLINAIFYVIRTGIQWRAMPKDFPKWSSVYYHFRKWCKDGTWQQLNETLRQQERLKRGRKPQPSGVIIDSQSVKTTEAGGERGYDGGKNIKGRKRHVAADTVGNLVEVVVNAASTQDRAGAKALFDKFPAETIAAIKKVWADGNYSGQPFLDWVQDTLHADLEITYRPPNAKGFIVVPIRWVVERTLAWLGRYRRLSKDYEHCTKSSEGTIYLASIATMLKRLASAP